MEVREINQDVIYVRGKVLLRTGLEGRDNEVVVLTYCRLSITNE